MILELFKYFARYSQKDGVISIFANGASCLSGYNALLDYVKALPDPLLPDIEHLVFGQSLDTVKNRVANITGTYLFVDYGEFSASRNARNSILDHQKIAVTVATKLQDSSDMMEEAVVSDSTLTILTALLRYLVVDSNAGTVPWLEDILSEYDIIPFVAGELKSIGWTLIFRSSASDYFDLKQRE